ncbi:glycosyltransferase family 2 protein [Paludibacterium paludis]|uniref:Glycosyltransferase 2-like domain-containing protein n=1 Tax=Paludibacterium paludis TaxID=1225769 RepID=A0A918U9V0_9NEIS|nr:glycosyltransferase family 2 protein [Paludibacterium paludis]GGY15634.1 hypothetical protein GCM10011289_18680 [Paludibacterium paludis]
MTHVRFSIATPAWNALDKLRRCVGSVRGQTGVTYEHLVQDGGSSDGTAEWLAAQSDVAGVSEKDHGMYDAINRAWSRGSGEFFSWLNADEQYLPGTLEKVAAYFDSHPDVDIVFANAIVADMDGKVVALRREIPFRKSYVVNSFLNTMSCTLFFRKRLREQGLLAFDTGYRYAGDMDLILRLVEAGAVIAHLPDYLSVFGVDGSNLSTHQRMQDETVALQKKFGAFSSGWLRQAVLVGRRIERLVIGAYKPETISYLYAVDETPSYHRITASGIGGRYTLADVRGRADTIEILRHGEA